MEEEEIVFKEEKEEKIPGSSGLFDWPFLKSEYSNVPQPYTTRTGRVVRPVKDYIPSMGTEKRYGE